ncbi:MAG: HesA/MoeB/ThiF family protein [Pirellulaceae bacterium]
MASAPRPVGSTSPCELSPEEWERYARQLGPGVLTPQGQVRLKQSTVFVTRAGGMGGPAALMLAMAGIGRLVIAHSGQLLSPDLNRQVLGAEQWLGQPRAAQFAEQLRSMNRFVTVESIDHEPSEVEARDWARVSDVLLACAPTFEERLRLNAAAVAQGTPLIDAAQWGMTGTLMTLRPGHTACLQCVYPQTPPFEEMFPVVGAVSSAMGSLAALESIKIISGCGRPMWGKLLTYDGFQGQMREIELRRDPECRCCSRRWSGE